MLNGRTKQSGLTMCLITFSLMITNMTDVFGKMFEGHFSPCGSEYPLPAFLATLMVSFSYQIDTNVWLSGKGTFN